MCVCVCVGGGKSADWNESFVFEVTDASEALTLTVLDWDKGQDDVIGVIQIDNITRDYRSRGNAPAVMDLELRPQDPNEKQKPGDTLGALTITLEFVPKPSTATAPAPPARTPVVEEVDEDEDEDVGETAGLLDGYPASSMSRREGPAEKGYTLRASRTGGNINEMA